MRFKGGILWTACGDSIARAYDAKSGSLKRSFIGHEAAVNCLVVTEGKLYTGSSDGTLRIWDAKDVSEDLIVDDGPPPPIPTETPEGEEETAEEAVVEETAEELEGEEEPADESEPVEEADVQDIEGEEAGGEGGEEEAAQPEEGAEDGEAEEVKEEG